VSAEARRTADRTVDHPDPPDADAAQWLRLAQLSREAVSPLARTEHALLPLTSFIIVPLFAFANAGIELSGEQIGDAVTSPVTIGVLLGLVIGKVVGISGAVALAVSTRFAPLPAGARFPHVVGASAVAGIGFTVSLFMAELAFEDRGLIDEAKVGILAASVIAGGVGWTLLRLAPSVDEGPSIEEEEEGAADVTSGH
jgi:Na+/H+ antiporter NhaA